MQIYLICFAGKCAMLFAMNRRLSEVEWSGAEMFTMKRNAPFTLRTVQSEVTTSDERRKNMNNEILEFHKYEKEVVQDIL